MEPPKEKPMTHVIHEAQTTHLPRAQVVGESLWLDQIDLQAATGWVWKPEGLCRGETCVPLPHRPEPPLVQADRLDVAGLWRFLGWPVVHDLERTRWVLGVGVERRAELLTSPEAPDFALPDLSGHLHRLSDYRGSKVLLFTWASWCGCRAHLSAWQELHEATKAHGFTVLAIALDHADAARPWVEAARPSFPCLIDRDHRTAELYNFLNVPQAVWLDEAGRMVRPPETAGMTDSFRQMNRDTFALPEPAREERERVKSEYLEAVRDWALRGADSLHALTPEGVVARLSVPDVAATEAHAHFRLAQVLLDGGHHDEAAAEFAEATRLHPASWAMWRQAAEKDARGLAVGEGFWQRVDALGDRPYYPPAKLGAP
jgi:peroxiredoxin